MAGTIFCERNKERVTVLIVDNERDMVDMLYLRLSKSGFDVFKAETGEEALDKVSEIYPDIILLDIMLPKMDGFEIKSRLNSERGTASIPVIFLTSRSDLHSKLEGYKLGIDDYVVKPFNSEELVARMRAVLKRREFYEEISMTDALTGLYNRHYFQNELRTFFVIAKRYRQMFSLAVIDIDGLKTINDTYGHGAGDHLLISFAETAKKVMRESDILIRQGGDEFAMIFPDVDAANASLAMKRLTDAIGRKKLVYKDHGVALPFSMSTGIVEFSAKFKDENEMFKLADSLMYEDKKSKKK